MNNPGSQEIVKRFFECAEYLYEVGKIKNDRRLALDVLKVSQPTVALCKRDHSSQRFQMQWLTIFVVDYGISAEFLITGRGPKTTIPNS